ncbi:hypothetical protein M422DRAFT_264830 [Sphaerobolus stellatus SS14]|uniref:Uncharacterized protein n=1 Tax=Sphaerobolus stellatus (strain SS14) TaxID=990650 RepID=A0A0C9V7E0_SPHS4|nr:hypothetical protein M422DRAFT_264830 [Sphaerobolus stellatus SS14]
MLAVDNTPFVSISVPGLKYQDNELRKLADHELADRRMELMCCLIRKFSEGVIFLNYPRLPTEEYRWCQKSFPGYFPMLYDYDDEFYPRSYKKYGENICRKNPKRPTRHDQAVSDRQIGPT